MHRNGYRLRAATAAAPSTNIAPIVALSLVTVPVAVLCLALACSSTGETASSSRRNALAEAKTSKPLAEKKPRWTTSVEPKALDDRVRKGLDWLVEHQHESGGWSQGEESADMGNGMQALRDKPNVADTCMGALALVRSGEGFAKARYAAALARAVGFVCGKIEASDRDSLSVTDVQGTRVQAKIGTYIDTFLASMLLSEVKDRLDDPASNERAGAALAKVLDKIQKNQKANGGWGGEGWAPVLSQSMGIKGVNRALQNGAVVDKDFLERSDLYVRALSSTSPASAGAAPGSAGVSLYQSAAGLGAVQDSSNTKTSQERELRERMANAKSEDEKRSAAEELGRVEVFKKAQVDAQAEVIGHLDEPAFVAGFGSNGGEEFLSYMNISESLVTRADDVWRKWDQAMTQNLDRVQNSDGSWTGHHCITGRTFCTSAALLVRMADRTPVPVEIAERAK